MSGEAPKRRIPASFWVWPAVWLAAVALFTLFPLEDTGFLMFLASIATLGNLSLLPLGVGLAAVVVLSKSGQDRMRVCLPVAALLIGLPAYDLLPLKLPLRVRMSFLLRRGELEQIVTQAQADPKRDWDGPVKVDEGPPVRVAYVMGGMIDNWYGYVWDPTDRVTMGNSRAPFWKGGRTSMTGVFGGDLVYATPLGGHWYWCSFT